MHSKTPVPESLFQLSYRPKAYNFIKKDTLAQVFFCKFCEISKNTFFKRTLPVVTSANSYSNLLTFSK